MSYWTGIGGRALLPQNDPAMFKRALDIGGVLTARGHILRSGGAEGADTAFEAGVDIVDKSLKEIYVIKSKKLNTTTKYHALYPDCVEYARKYCPHYDNIADFNKQYHDRNVHQVLGQNLDDPSKVVVCWTETGEKMGGTSTALNAAEDWNIPIINLNSAEYREYSIHELVRKIIDIVEK